MTVKLTTSIVGQAFSYAAGDVAEFTDAQAASLIRAGFAEPVKKTKATRTTSIPQTDLETPEAK
jgi:hypothetical protein